MMPNHDNGLPALATGEIHLWQRSLTPATTQINHLHTLLSKDEKQRAERLHTENHRNAFVTARGTLRILLGHYLHIPPAKVCFRYNRHGKPDLKHNQPPLYFNLSHSGQWSIYAISHAGPLGIDLEKIRPASPQKRLNIARRFFSPVEWKQLHRLPSTQLNAAFFACWTRKEAYIKCHGLGLALSLSGFSVSVDPEKPACIQETPWQPNDRNHSQLYDLPAPEGYRAALALTSPQTVSLHHFLWAEQKKRNISSHLEISYHARSG